MGLGSRRRRQRRQRQQNSAAGIVGDLSRQPAAAWRLVDAELRAAEASTTTELALQERRVAALAASIALGEAGGAGGAAPDEDSRRRTEAKKVFELPPPWEYPSQGLQPESP